MWIEFQASMSGAIGETLLRTCLVNMDDVKKITPRDREKEQGSKLTFKEGDTMLVAESLEWIKAMIGGTLEQGFKASEPKEL